MDRFHTYALLTVSSAGQLFQNAAGLFKTIGNGVIVICGVVLMIYSTWRIANNIMRGGKGGPPPPGHWIMPVLALWFGGVFAIGGFSDVFSKFAEGGGETFLETLMAGAGGGGSTSSSGGGGSASGINLSALFTSLGDEVGSIATGVAACAGAIMIFMACVQLTKILVRPMPAPPMAWCMAFLTLFVGGIISNSWWDGSGAAQSAKSWSEMIRTTISSVADGAYTADTSGRTPSGGGASVDNGSHRVYSSTHRTYGSTHKNYGSSHGYYGGDGTQADLSGGSTHKKYSSEDDKKEDLSGGSTHARYDDGSVGDYSETVGKHDDVYKDGSLNADSVGTVDGRKVYKDRETGDLFYLNEDDDPVWITHDSEHATGTGPRIYDKNGNEILHDEKGDYYIDKNTGKKVYYPMTGNNASTEDPNAGKRYDVNGHEIQSEVDDKGNTRYYWVDDKNKKHYYDEASGDTNTNTQTGKTETTQEAGDAFYDKDGHLLSEDSTGQYWVDDDGKKHYVAATKTETTASGDTTKYTIDENGKKTYVTDSAGHQLYNEKTTGEEYYLDKNGKKVYTTSNTNVEGKTVFTANGKSYYYDSNGKKVNLSVSTTKDTTTGATTTVYKDTSGGETTLYYSTTDKNGKTVTGTAYVESGTNETYYYDSNGKKTYTTPNSSIAGKTMFTADGRTYYYKDNGSKVTVTTSTVSLDNNVKATIYRDTSSGSSVYYYTYTDKNGKVQTGTAKLNKDGTYSIGGSNVKLK